MRRAVLVIGAGAPRNEAVAHAHGMLTRDGANPNEMITIAEAELDRYPSAELVDARVTSIKREPDLFRIHFDRGTSTASRVILATGVNDDPPPIPGLAEYWGRGVFTCPFCDGYEHRDLPITVIGDTATASHLARLLTAVSNDVTLRADVDTETHATLQCAGVDVDHRGVTRIVGDGNRVTSIEVADGSTLATGAVFLAGTPRPNTQLARDLGSAIHAQGFVEVDTSFRTTVEHVWAVGDVATLHHQIPIAIAHGITAGADCVATLVLT